MNTKNKQLGYKSLAKCVMDYLKQQLVDGEISPGEEINLSKLGEILGVSRTPIREALIQLLKDGFIEDTTRKGFRIKKLIRKDIDDLYEIGGLLESELVNAASEKMTDADIAKLEKYQEKIESEFAHDNYGDYLELNKAFNDFLWSFCPNQLLSDYLNKIQERLYFAHKRSGYPEWNLMLVSDHREMIGYLKNRDKTSLTHLLREQHWNPDRYIHFIRRMYKLTDPDENSTPSV